MVKVVDCPLCNGGKLKIDISRGYKPVFNGVMSKLPMIVHCKNCNRNVKYKVVEEEQQEQKQ